MMDVKDARKIIKDLSEKTFICSEHCIETESGYVITTKEKRKYARSKKQTNADRIRNMSDEELAEFMFAIREGKAGDIVCDADCYYCRIKDETCKRTMLKWLQAEVKEGAE